MSSKHLTTLENVFHRDEDLILNDGVSLKSRIWLPSKKGKWPALLMRQPYRRQIASTVTYAHPSWFASHGFLVVIQDVRGQGDSEGEFLGFSQEASDTSETHEWVRNLPECNGLLGTYGFSYQGLTQLTAKPETPPPNCLAPAMTGLNESDHWSSEGGAFWWHINLSWGLQLAAQKARRIGNKAQWHEIRESLENGSYLKEGPLLLEKYDPDGMVNQWLIKANQNSDTLKVHKPLRTWLKQPMLLIGGWWDPHLNGILDIYQKSLESGGDPELHIGPATHLQWWNGTQRVLLEFFKKYLHKSNNFNFVHPKQLLWNISSKEWESYNPQKKSLQKWGLNSSGLACQDTSNGVLRPNSKSFGFEVLVHDPWRAVPSVGGHLSPEPGLIDRSELDKRPDVATFTSAPLSKNLRIEGKPILEIEAYSDRDSFDLCVALSIVNKKKSKVIQLSTGLIRIIEGNKTTDSKTRKIKLQPLLADFEKGTSIRISIAGAAWPAIGINPGDSQQNCSAVNPDFLVTTIYLKISQSIFYFSPLI